MDVQRIGDRVSPPRPSHALIRLEQGAARETETLSSAYPFWVPGGASQQKSPAYAARIRLMAKKGRPIGDDGPLVLLRPVQVPRLAAHPGDATVLAYEHPRTQDLHGLPSRPDRSGPRPERPLAESDPLASRPLRGTRLVNIRRFSMLIAPVMRVHPAACCKVRATGDLGENAPD
jgi:hypothetical protein